MFGNSTLTTVASGLMFVLMGSAGMAESPYKSMDYGPGQAEFMNSCAACHGSDAMGGGQMAELLTVPVPDLTTLSQNNGGEFPMLRIMKVIDGRDGVRSHGGPMPVWGDRYFASADPSGGDLIPELITQGRVLALARYLEGIQK